MDEGRRTKVRGGDRRWVKLEFKYQSASEREDAPTRRSSGERRIDAGERKRDENGKIREREREKDDGTRCRNTESLYMYVCQRFAHSCAGALLRGCLISSSANQTPYTQNSIRSLHKRASQFGAPRMHNAPAVCSTRGQDLLYGTNGALKEGEREREKRLLEIIANSYHRVLLLYIGKDN